VTDAAEPTIAGLKMGSKHLAHARPERQVGMADDRRAQPRHTRVPQLILDHTARHAQHPCDLKGADGWGVLRAGFPVENPDPSAISEVMAKLYLSQLSSFRGPPQLALDC
jgi:hypothetical protein